MSTATDLVSPKQVARAIGVSESSLKRWCDQKLIKMIRTAGGHRKMSIAEVIRFAQKNNYPIVEPELLGLPPVSRHAELGLTRAVDLLAQALLTGDELLVRQIVFDLVQAGHSINRIADRVLAPAFQTIGERWACHEVDVYQERRGCEMMLRLLFELRRILPPPATEWRAIGGTIAGDQYELPATTAELVLREAGFQATSLGCSLPWPSLVKAARDLQPKLFWLSISHIAPEMNFVTEFANLSQACTEIGTALVVGGRALTPELRQQMSYSAYCDTMQHLATFAETLLRSMQKREKPQQKTRKSSTKG